MASINNLTGYNRQASSVNKLLAVYGNDIIDVSTSTGYKLNIANPSEVTLTIFLDSVFFFPYQYASEGVNQIPLTFDGTTWSTKNVERMPLATYAIPFKSRLYLGQINFTNPGIPFYQPPTGNPAIVTFPSRVFYSDLAEVSTGLTMGLEWGGNGKTIAGSNLFRLNSVDFSYPTNSQNFVTRKIKVGDPLFFTNNYINSSDPKVYRFTVKEIGGPYILRTIENFEKTQDSIYFWVGSNWFDVGTDDNDKLTGFGSQSDRLIIFKLMSLWYYTGSQKKQVKDAVGTSSWKSIINKKGYTYYFHGSDPYLTGIYRYDGVDSLKISRAIDPFIEGMSTANYTSVVAWEEGENLRFFLGDLTNTNRVISMTNAVATLNTVTNSWDVSPIADVITCATTFRTSNRRDTYCGTSDNQIIKMNSGNSHNGTPINLLLETKVYYPAGSDVINEFSRLQVIGRQTKGVKIKIKLWDNPKGVGEWKNIGELDNDKTELLIPNDYNTASGIQVGFFENGSLENDLYVEKLTIFYKTLRSRII